MTVYQAKINAASSGDNTIVAAQTGKVIRVVAIMFTCAGEVTVTIKSSSGTSTTALTGAMSFAEFGGMSDHWMDSGRLDTPYFVETAVGEALVFTLGGSVQVSGTLNYVLL